MSRMATSDGGGRTSLLLSTNRKLAAIIITSRIPTVQNPSSSNEIDDYLGLDTPKIKSVEQEIERLIHNRDEETVIDIVVKKADGSTQLIERWKIHHDLKPLDGFNQNPSTQNVDNATLMKQMTCLSRALSAYLPLLPAARVSRACQTYLDQNLDPPLVWDFCMYQANRPSTQRHFKASVHNFLFKPIVTPRGMFRVTLHYQINLNELDFTPLESDSFGLEILEDYASVRSQHEMRHNNSTRVHSSSVGHRSSRPNAQQLPHSLPHPTHSDDRRRSPMHQPQQTTEQHQLRHSHSTPFSVPEPSPTRDDHASSPPIAIPRPGHSHSNSLNSHSYNHSPRNQYPNSLPSRAQDRLGRSPSLSSSRPHSHTPAASYSPVSPFMGPQRRTSLSMTPRSSLITQPLPESPIPPIHGMLGSSTASLSREAQIGHEIERVGNIAPPQLCFTNDPSGTPKLRSMKADIVMKEAREALAEFAQRRQQQQEAV